MALGILAWRWISNSVGAALGLVLIYRNYRSTWVSDFGGRNRRLGLMPLRRIAFRIHHTIFYISVDGGGHLEGASSDVLDDVGFAFRF